MRKLLKFIIATIVAVAAVVAIRTFAFTLSTVKQGGVYPQLRAGDVVLVNRLATGKCQKGDLVVFDSRAPRIGRVDALPGDTVPVNGKRYRIPLICCTRCGCNDCQLYLVTLDSQQILVHRHQLIGKAIKLFHGL